jgi:hypothetical protein
MDVIRKEVEERDYYEGFLIAHAFAGGTGSGLYSNLLQKLSTNFPKSILLPLSLHPPPPTHQLSTYNLMLSYNSTQNQVSLQPILDNQALHKNFLA